MPSDIIWLTFEDVSYLHDRGIELFGGSSGTREESGIHSAIDAPQKMYEYEEEDDVLALGLRLCVRLCKNHGYVDGNKRVALACLQRFLALNGFQISTELDAGSGYIDESDPDQREWSTLEYWIKQLAASEFSEDALYEMLEQHIEELEVRENEGPQLIDVSEILKAKYGTESC